MKLHKRMIYILGAITIVLMGIIVMGNYQLCVPIEKVLKAIFPGVFVGQRAFWLNILMGILGSVFVSFIIEIVNYIVAKKNSLVAFLQKANELNMLYKNVTYAFTSVDAVDFERELYKEILNYNISDLYNAYYDIDFIFRHNKYSLLLQEIYIQLCEIKYSVESQRKKILFSEKERFEERHAEAIHKIFYEIQKLCLQNGYQQVFHSETISNKIQILENYLFKCVWYRVERSYKLVDKICKLKPKFIFDKIAMFLLEIEVIKWSPTICKECVNVYNQKEYIYYVKLPFVKYKIYRNKPIRIDKPNT